MSAIVSAMSARAMRMCLADRPRVWNKSPPQGLHSRRGVLMPPWVELLLNVIAFAGFIAIAKYHKSRGEKLPDR